MWIEIDLTQVEARGMDYIRERIAHYTDLEDENAQKYRDAATVTDGEIEVDEDAVVSVSEEDGGAYVMSWQWVSDEEAGL